MDESNLSSKRISSYCLCSRTSPIAKWSMPQTTLFHHHSQVRIQFKACDKVTSDLGKGWVFSARFESSSRHVIKLQVTWARGGFSQPGLNPAQGT